ncbi:MAG TPA: type II and III secretion system protein family protein, partial [Thermohalobaculum sp.]|nr:type II and III secretion system protein family protein [Thermohalobaculum sp.]
VIVESTQPFVEVSVAQPGIADVSPLSDRTLYVFGKQRGITTLTLLGENGALITSVTINVTPDINELKERLSEVLPTEPISVRLVGGNIALSGVVDGADKAERAVAVASSFGPVMNMMTIGGTQQVMIKVKVAEMSRAAAKSLGFDVGIFHQGSKVSNVFGSGRGVSGFEGVGFGGGDAPVPTVELDAFGILGTIARFGDIGLNITLQTLEQKGFSRTLAEPNLVALSGSSAKFLAGKDVPVPTVDQDGDTNVTFKEVGIKIDFTPTVLDNQTINLRLSTEVSSVDTTPGQTISFAAGDVTTFSTRRANTVIELKDGESFAIAGLLQDDFNDSISQFPWLGDIPILGTLFRSTQYARGESELVIIVSAHLVTPVDGDELSLPQDHVRIPNEMELFLLGQTVSPGAAGMVQSQGFDGDFGYVVE